MTTRVLPSGAWEARFTHHGRAYSRTWPTKRQATAWEQRTRADLAAGTHPDSELEDASGKPLPPTLATYALKWLETRPLRPRTRVEYTRMITNHVLGHRIAGMRLDRITRAHVRGWYEQTETGPVHRAHVYAVLRSIFNTAVVDELITVNPVLVPGAGRVKRKPIPELPTAVQVHQLADAMGGRYRVMALVAAWCGLRLGELLELRRKDITLDDAGMPVAIHVRRAVVRVEGANVIGPPKSAAGVRRVAIPPHVRGDVSAHLAGLPSGGERLLFPGRSGHLNPSTLYESFHTTRDRVGLSGLKWHHLRHFSATAAAQSGATIAELQGRLGHSSPAMALKYQHATAERDAQLADAMSTLANVVPLKPRPAPEPEPNLEDDLSPVWLRLRTGGAWHLGGDAGRAYCGMRLHGDVEVTHGDQPAGRMCRACAQRRARGA